MQCLVKVYDNLEHSIVLVKIHGFRLSKCRFSYKTLHGCNVPCALVIK